MIELPSEKEGLDFVQVLRQPLPLETVRAGVAPGKAYS